MALKRKRSTSELVTLFNSPARSDSSVESFDFPISPSLAFPRAFATPSHLDSRTRKRFRDNRPSQEEVHQRTLKMLYSAQQQDQHMEAEFSPSPAPPVAAARNTQKSLHSFWNIKSAQPPVSRMASPPVHQRALSPMSCEDCGVLTPYMSRPNPLQLEIRLRTFPPRNFPRDPNLRLSSSFDRQPSLFSAMAEALGLASSIIAVADLTGKTIALTIKLKALWEEVKDVPVTLLEKAEHLQHLEELLDLAEQDAAEDYTPTAIWNAINRARAAKNDVQNTIDAYTEELVNRRRYRRRLAAAKFVIHKDDLRTVEQKLDRALELYKLANNVIYGRYNRLIYKQLAESTSTVVISTPSQSPIIDSGDSTGYTSSQVITVKAAKPRKNTIFEGSSVLGRLCFDYYDETYSFSMRVPDCHGFNLLHFALEKESIETVKWLLSCGLYPGSFDECRAGVEVSAATFYRVLGDIVRVDPEDITFCYGGDILGFDGGTSLYAFLRRLSWYWNPPEVLDQLLRSAITYWATILYDSGVDLLHYGRKVRDIYQKIGWCVSDQTVSRIDPEDRNLTGIPYTCSLLGITYGALPSQWKLWWAPNINDYAADFWNLVEDSSSNSSGFNVPGGWTDDFADENDDEDDEKIPFIWSEFRKIRPPI
ncbi:orf21 protein [Colletotrichum kahawae]|uniref:Orf21 protein n=1 Tax=Colletotrichum kahawae TaxID=34407 RepID=A0AAD9Y9Q6_COLKA|nr:orf21 protein [Colletotrichum kahawae]